MKVLLRVPCVETIDRDLTRWLIWCAKEDPSIDINLTDTKVGCAEARNKIVEEFLHSDASHLWMIDSDVIPPRNLSLIKEAGELEVVNGLYQQLGPMGLVWDTWTCRHTPGTIPKFNLFEQKSWPGQRHFEVGGVGGGCMLIRREVLEQFIEKKILPFEFRFGASRAMPALGEDFDFCVKLKTLNIPLTVDSYYRCGHTKAVDFRIIDQWAKR